MKKITPHPSKRSHGYIYSSRHCDDSSGTSGQVCVRNLREESQYVKHSALDHPDFIRKRMVQGSCDERLFVIFTITRNEMIDLNI